MELHVKELEEKGSLIMKEFSSSGVGGFKNEIIEELKSMRYNNLEDMVHRRELTCNEFLDKLDRKYIAASTIG